MSNAPNLLTAAAAPTLLRRLLHSRLALTAVALLLAFAFQGTRGLWEPDEGRYTQVAMEMLRSGDWVTPHRHPNSIHPTKPPLTYWAIAASVGMGGRNEWAVRAPNAIAFALTVACLFGIGRRFTPALPGLPAALYATTALPFFAANLVTTDTLLTLWTTLGAYAYIGARWPLRAAQRGGHWLLLMWTGFALAFLTKGPPALLVLLALIVFDRAQPNWRTRELFGRRELLVFAVLAAGWYVVVALRNPGLLTRLIEAELVARVASDEAGHYPQWWGGLYVYALTLLLGALPWGALALRRVRELPLTPTRWRALSREGRMLATWLLLPLVVFLIARSRMPLYLLPLFPAIALMLARLWLSAPEQLARLGIALVSSALLLLVVKAGAAQHEHNKDARAFADAIERRLPFRPQELVFVDISPRYGLGFYLDVATARAGIGHEPARGNDIALDRVLTDHTLRRLYLVRPESYAVFLRLARVAGNEVVHHGSAHRLELIELRRGPG